MSSSEREQVVIHPQVLGQVVRLEQGDPDYEITEWTSAVLSSKGIINPEGLILVSGAGCGRDGRQTRWEVVRKSLTFGGDPPGWFDEESERELRLAESGFFDHLPGPLKAPRVYHASRTPQGGQIWMEMIHDALPPRWRWQDYLFAAREIGRFHANCIRWTDCNDLPFLEHYHTHKWVGLLENFPVEDIRANPYIREYIPAEMLAAQERLYAERERFFEVLERAPQVIGHYDLHRRNLLLRPVPGGQAELVAVDWAMTGLGPLGGELYALIAGGGVGFEIDTAQAFDLDRAIFPAFIEGMRAEGWDGRVEDIRLAYTSFVAMWLCDIPGLIVAWTGEGFHESRQKQFGCGPEEYAAEAAHMLRFGLACAEEARGLMGN